MGKRLNVLTIDGRRTGYSIEQVYDMTMTVGELIEALEGYDKDMPVLLNNDNGYTYGEIAWDSLQEESEDLDDDEEEEYEEEEEDDDDDDDLEEGCGRSKKHRKKLKESVGNGWRGCIDVFMQGHGDWADPDIYIENEDGLFVFNYYDIEDALWNDFLESEGIEEKDTYDERGNISDEWEEKFSEYCRNNAYDYITYDLLPEGGYFTDEQCSKDGKFCSWNVDDVKEYDAEQEDDEDDYDYDDEDIDESCSGDKKKVKKKELKESNENKVYYASFFAEVDIPIEASSVEEAKEKAYKLVGTETEDGLYLSEFRRYIYPDHD